MATASPSSIPAPARRGADGEQPIDLAEARRRRESRQPGAAPRVTVRAVTCPATDRARANEPARQVVRLREQLGRLGAHYARDMSRLSRRLGDAEREVEHLHGQVVGLDARVRALEDELAAAREAHLGTVFHTPRHGDLDLPLLTDLTGTLARGTRLLWGLPPTETGRARPFHAEAALPERDRPGTATFGA